MAGGLFDLGNRKTRKRLVILSFFVPHSFFFIHSDHPPICSYLCEKNTPKLGYRSY